MKRQRSALLIDFLNQAVDACQETDVLSLDIEETQEAWGLELAWWNELMSDLDTVERNVREHLRAVLRSFSAESAGIHSDD